MSKKTLKKWYPFLDDPEGIQARNSDVIKTSRAITGLTLEDVREKYGISENRFYVCSSRTPRENERNPVLSSLNFLAKFAKLNNMTLPQYILTITGTWDTNAIKKKRNSKPKRNTVRR